MKNKFEIHIPLAMKLTVVLVFCLASFASAGESYGQNTLLDIHANNKTIEEVLTEIGSKSDFAFFYNSKLINVRERVTLDIERKNIFTILDELFKNKRVKYRVVDKSIILTNVDAESDQQQPTKTISGIVVDDKGEPIIGATVVERGQKTGTITNMDGQFHLTVSSNFITVSYIGYQTQSVRVTPGKQLKVILLEDTELLNEVVVVGYATQRRENLTGAVSSVDVNKSISGRSIPDVGRGLQGVAPGLSVTIPDGEVGSDPQMKIRGSIASIEGSSSPLILLDNVEIPSIQVVNPNDIESISILKDAASASIYGSKAAFGVVLLTSKKGARTDQVTVSYTGSFSWENMAKKYDMSSVNGLQYMMDARAREKDSAHTGHYSYDGLYVGSYFRVNEESLARSYEWVEKYGGKLGVNDPMVYGRDWFYSGGRIFGVRPYNIYDYMIRENAPSTQHNLSVNGKAKNTTFNIGLGYLQESGMMKTAKDDSFTKYNASVKVETAVNEWLTFRGGMMYSSRSKKYPFLTESTSDGPWLYLYRWSPLVPLGYNEDDEIIRSPMSETMQASTATMRWNYTNVNAGMTLKPVKDWNINVDYTFSNQEYIRTYPGATLSGANYRGTPELRLDAEGNQIYVNADGIAVNEGSEGAMPAYKLPWADSYNGTSKPNLYKRSHENSYRHTLNATTDYTLKLRDIHTIRLMLGINLSTYDASSQSTQVTELSDFTNPQFSFGTGTWTGSGSASWQSQLGYFGRLNYNLMEKYLFEANLRYDGSSKFPTDLRWEWFPSFSAGWRLGEEAFMEFAKPSLSSLKVRASWGTIGDQTVSSSLYIPTMSTGQSGWIDGAGNLMSYVGTPSAVSAAITWQSIQTLDIGIDARFWDERIGVSFDWFQRDTKNMIVPTDGVNTVTYGSSAPKANNGSLRTVGWELSIDGNYRFQNGLNLNLMVSVSDARSKITGYGDTKSLDNWYVGKTYGEIWGFKVDRLYQWSDFETDGSGNLIYRALTADDTNDTRAIGLMSYILKPGTNGKKPVYQSYFEGSSFHFGPGDVKYVDVDGDGILSQGTQTTDDHGDMVVIGNETPRYEYSFRVGADWKGFDLSLFFQGVGKRQIWGDGPLAISGWYASDGAMANAFAADYWTLENTDAFYPAAYNMGQSNDGYNMLPNDRYLLNMAYLRLKNITVGYTCPVKWSQKVGISKARVYFTAENLLTWDNLRGLPIDPEAVTGTSMWGSNYSQGRTGVGTPVFKTVSVGFQLNF
jgi:TonB-linked SusC/RagA family outer membrane protein